MVPQPTSAAPSAASRREQSRRAFANAFSSASKEDERQESTQKKTSSKPAPPQPSDLPPSSTGSMPSLTLSGEAAEAYMKLLRELPAGSDLSAVATEKFMGIVRGEVAANPTALKVPQGSFVDEDQFVGLIKDFTIDTSKTMPLDRDAKERASRQKNFKAVPKDTEQLSPEARREQAKVLKESEQARVRLGMPRSLDPEVSKRHINDFLDANGEAPFSFEKLYEIDDASMPTGKAIRMEQEAMSRLTDLNVRKPSLYEKVFEMIQVYIDKALLRGGYLKPSRSL